MIVDMMHLKVLFEKSADSELLRLSPPRREIVQVMPLCGREAAFAEAMRAAFGMYPPGPGCAASAGDATAIWVQPTAWLLCAPRGAEGALAARAAAAFDGLAAVEDQSHGRTTIRISGPTARAVLSRGCRVDLHPRAFGPGRAASTMIAHVGCLVHQVDDAPSYDLVVFSTFAQTFLDWLLHAAAEDGLVVE
jgi:heterotetrameric sarcosine oxidase gamma subunit